MVTESVVVRVVVARAAQTAAIAFAIFMCSTMSAAGAQAPVGAPEPPSQSVEVAFDLPPDFTARQADGTFTVTALEVGYFSGDRVVRRLMIPREAVTVQEGTGRVTVPLLPIQGGPIAVQLRIRSWSAKAFGSWAPGVGPVELPGPPQGERRARTRPERQLSEREVERYPRLAEALRAAVGPDAALAQTIASFRRAQDLAVALVVARRERLSLTEIGAALRQGTDTSLEDAVKKLRPGIDAAAVVRDARREARPLLARPPRTPRR